MNYLVKVVVTILTLIPLIYAQTEELESIGIGVASNKNEAIKLALRDAVEKAVGVFLMSETEVKDYQLTRDEIITYSNGLINKYELSSTEKLSDKLIEVTLKVFISDKALNYTYKQKKYRYTIDSQNLYARTIMKFERIENGISMIDNFSNNFFKTNWHINLDEQNISDDFETKTIKLEYSLSAEMSNYLFEITDFIRLFKPLNENENTKYLYINLDKLQTYESFSSNKLTIPDLLYTRSVKRTHGWSKSYYIYGFLSDQIIDSKDFYDPDTVIINIKNKNDKRIVKYNIETYDFLSISSESKDKFFIKTDRVIELKKNISNFIKYSGDKYKLEGGPFEEYVAWNDEIWEYALKKLGDMSIEFIVTVNDIDNHIIRQISLGSCKLPLSFLLYFNEIRKFNSEQTLGKFYRNFSFSLSLEELKSLSHLDIEVKPIQKN